VTKFGLFLKACISSRFAWLIVTVHAAWFFLAIANMSPPSHGLGERIDRGAYVSASLLAGRPFHFEYESIALKLLVLVDLPPFLAGIPVSLLLMPLHRVTHYGSYVASYVAAATLFIVSSCQWLAVGKLIESRIGLNRPEDHSLKRLNRFFAAAIALILLVTVIVTPMVNARSRRLGFRHAAISFR
jgi:hypothetical protein